MKRLIAIAMTAVLCGCAGLWGGVVTVTEVRDSAMKELASLNKQNLLSAETDEKIANADLAYRQAAEVSAKALRAYQETGDKVPYIAALNATKAAVSGILDILTPLIAQQKAIQYRTQLMEAAQL